MRPEAVRVGGRRAYRTARVALLRPMRDEPTDAADGLMARPIDEAFPTTLADRYEVADWHLDSWERFQGAVLTLFEAVGIDPVDGIGIPPRPSLGIVTETTADGASRPRRDPRTRAIAARWRRVGELSNQGLTVQAIANLLGVNVRTVYADRAALRNQDRDSA